jgi:hypothetical protein
MLKKNPLTSESPPKIVLVADRGEPTIRYLITLGIESKGVFNTETPVIQLNFG